MTELTISEARAEALSVIVQIWLGQLPIEQRTAISDLAHAAGEDIGVRAVQAELCFLLACRVEGKHDWDADPGD